jgi:uncharacterized membrane protein
MSGSIALIVILIGVVFVWRIRREMRSGYPMQDERTSMISGKAALRALWIGYAFMVAELLWLIFGYEFFGQPEPDAGWMLLAAMIVLSGSLGVLSVYYGRKGDLR